MSKPTKSKKLKKPKKEKDPLTPDKTTRANYVAGVRLTIAIREIETAMCLPNAENGEKEGKEAIAALQRWQERIYLALEPKQKKKKKA